MMTTPYLKSKQHKFWTIVFWVMIVIVWMFLLTGCAKKQDSVGVAANAAHQQITATQKSLPKECQTEAIDEQFKAQHASVDTIVSNCEMQKEKITAEKIRWQWSFFGLAIIVLAYIARKVIK